jgi:hypothetical protein
MRRRRPAKTAKGEKETKMRKTFIAIAAAAVLATTAAMAQNAANLPEETIMYDVQNQDYCQDGNAKNIARASFPAHVAFKCLVFSNWRTVLAAPRPSCSPYWPYGFCTKQDCATWMSTHGPYPPGNSGATWTYFCGTKNDEAADWRIDSMIVNPGAVDETMKGAETDAPIATMAAARKYCNDNPRDNDGCVNRLLDAIPDRH